MKRVRNIVGILSIVIVSFSFFLVSLETANLAAVTDDVVQFDLSAKINSESFVSIEVKPNDYSFDKPIRFDVSINTH